MLCAVRNLELQNTVEQLTEDLRVERQRGEELTRQVAAAAIVKQEPGVIKQEPGIIKQEPGIIKQEPGIVKQERGVQRGESGPSSCTGMRSSR